MEYSEFEKQFIFKIEFENSASVITFLEENKKIVLEYLNNKEDPVHVKEFLLHISDVLLMTKTCSNIENVLKHPLMTLVWQEFKESDILIRACDQAEDTTIIKWLLTQPLNLFVKNNEGVTALMKAASHYNLEFVVDYLLSNTDDKYINLEDNNGNTALFYAIDNFSIFKKLLKRGMNYNHVNGDGDSLLMYTCKHEKFQPFDILIKKPDIDYAQTNHLGRNISIIIVEKNNMNALLKLNKMKYDVNYKSPYGETMVTAFFKSYRTEIEKRQEINVTNSYKRYSLIKNHSSMLSTLINLRCDFNVPVDDDGNTLIMYLLMVEDYVNCYVLLSRIPTIDLSIRNKYGINATYLSLFIKKKEIVEIQNTLPGLIFSYPTLKKMFVMNKTYDFSYADTQRNTPLIHEMYKNQFLVPMILKHAPPDICRYVNNKNENCIIVAAKLGNIKILECLLKAFHDDPEVKFDINHQDSLGNTALHYAVKIKDSSIISLLQYYGADANLENYDGKSPLILAKEMDAQGLIELLQAPPPLTLKGSGRKSALQSKIKRIINKPKGKSLDEELDDYIKNYQVNIFDKDYEYLNCYDHISLYHPSPSNTSIQKWLLECYFNKRYQYR